MSYFGRQKGTKRVNRDLEALRNKVSKTNIAMATRLEAIENKLPDDIDLREMLSMLRDQQRRMSHLEEVQTERTSHLKYMVNTLLVVITILVCILMAVVFT